MAKWQLSKKSQIMKSVVKQKELFFFVVRNKESDRRKESRENVENSLRRKLDRSARLAVFSERRSEG